ncbi:UNVERIFIED_CONTAM: hypothetical protein HDU68_010171 [Siphonaria sp. JEL0065]|nr:hypothetical protein HDU68_010171 [Siphonaria sp. JEL0065]
MSQEGGTTSGVVIETVGKASARFVAKDKEFRKGMGDATFLKRLCYRSVLTLVVEVINVMGGSRVASLGDEVVCVVKKARPASSADGAASAVSKLKKGDVARALVVRTVQPVRRLDGTFVKFDDNAVVMLSKQGTPLGNRVLGVVALEARQKRWAKIASLAPKMV